MYIRKSQKYAPRHSNNGKKENQTKRRQITVE